MVIYIIYISAKLFLQSHTHIVCPFILLIVFQKIIFFFQSN